MLQTTNSLCPLSSPLSLSLSALHIVQGSAVVFYSMLPDGNLDVESLHAGLPVGKGMKYIANLW